jgi:hypothetical protein
MPNIPPPPSGIIALLLLLLGVLESVKKKPRAETGLTMAAGVPAV